MPDPTARYQFGGSPADYIFGTGDDVDTIIRFAPNKSFTLWDSLVGGTQYTQITYTQSGDIVTDIRSDSEGRLPRFWGPANVTSMWVETGDSSRYFLATTDLPAMIAGRISQADADVRYAAASEIPSIVRNLGTTLHYVDYNVVTRQWPPRPDVGLAPVVWRGNAVRPAANVAKWGVDYVDQIEGVDPDVPDETPDPDPVTPNPDQITLSTPVASVNGASVNLTSTLTTTTEKSFTYLQIAVRGPSGQQADCAMNPGVVVNGAFNLTGSFTASASGAWRAYTSYNRTGGSNQSDWVDGPVVTFNVTLPVNENPNPDPGAGDFPLMGFSGLGWNSGCFTDNQWDQSSTAAFSAYRGRTADCRLVFGIHDQGATWENMLTVWDQWKGYAGITVISLGLQPQPTGNNAATARGDNNTRWENYGRALTAAGMNNTRTVLRLGWECNGDWYKWSWASPNAATYIAAFRNVVNSVKRYAPNVWINLNLNKDHPNQGGMYWKDVLNALKGSFDIVGFDGYDAYDGARNSETRYATWLAKEVNMPMITSWCRSNGKLIAFDEWALVNQANGSWDGTGGGDDPLYLRKRWEYLMANKDIVAYECYYHETGTGSPSPFHQLTNYPNSQTYYRASAQWGSH